MGGYQELYLKTDVFLLTGVLKKIRDMCLNYYGLDSDPVCYYTLPIFAFDAMLTLTGIKVNV